MKKSLVLLFSAIFFVLLTVTPAPAQEFIDAGVVTTNQVDIAPLLQRPGIITVRVQACQNGCATAGEFSDDSEPVIVLPASASPNMINDMKAKYAAVRTMSEVIGFSWTPAMCQVLVDTNDDGVLTVDESECNEYKVQYAYRKNIAIGCSKPAIAPILLE